MKQTLRSIIQWLLVFSGLNWLYLKISGQRDLILLRYHSVSGVGQSSERAKKLWPALTVSKDIFERQLQWFIVRNYKFIRFDQLEDLVNIGASIPSRRVLIYFDDGFKDVIENAYPILKKYNIPATIFLTTDFIDQKNIPWSIKLRAAFGIQAESIIRRLKLHTDPITAEREVTELLKDTDEPRNIFMEWQDVLAVLDVFQIGSHMVSHRRLTDLSTEEVFGELKDSKVYIEKKLDRTISTMSYPHGAYNDKIQAQAISADYRIIVTTDDGPNRSINLHSLQSIKPPRTMWRLAAEVGLWHPLRLFIKSFV